jgi:predicted phage terminase large subunit-like protein
MTKPYKKLLNQTKTKIQRKALVELAKRTLARRNLLDFTKYTMPTFDVQPYHEVYYKILDMFAKGKIKKLIITMPPQHGKSEGSTRRLPAYMLGLNPDLKLAIGSYNQTFARKFSRDVKRIINDGPYERLFPDTNLKNKTKDFSKAVDEWEIPNYKGSAKFVGREGPLTGNPVDVMIMDDLYKDYKEGNSPIIRENTQDWYTSVVRTRLHNDSQQLIVFTRWHEHDLIGYLESDKNPGEKVEVITSWEQLENPNPFTWYKINFEAIKESEATEFDNREKDQALWENKHGIQKLENERELDPEKFGSLYQGNPRPMQGLLYTKGFELWQSRPKKIKSIKAYVDVADEGSDFLCSIVYALAEDNNVYVFDVLYTQAPQEETENQVVAQFIKYKIVWADIESNNGGKGFARTIQRKLREQKVHNIRVEHFFQGGNKESRILANSANVQNHILMPYRWESTWPVFANDVKYFKKKFKSNVHDDGPDTLTGIYEKNENSLNTNSMALYEW